MRRLSRMEVIRKAIMVFEAIKRMASKGGASLEAERGAEDEYEMVDDCTAQLREILREMQEHDHDRELQRIAEEHYERRLEYEQRQAESSGVVNIGYANGLKDWQKDAAGGPPERLVL